MESCSEEEELPEQDLLLSESEELPEQDSSLSDNEAPILLEQPDHVRQFFVYKSEHCHDPTWWNGPIKKENGFTKDVFGLIVCVQAGTCYILTNSGFVTYAPKFLDETHKLVGCWVLFDLDPNNRICSTPEYAKPPRHTRVFKQDSDNLPYLLIYDYVKVLHQEEVYSKFLGRIRNNISLKGKSGKEWPECNVEYTIKCRLDSVSFNYDMDVVKFHGSIKLYTDLPRLLSFVQVREIRQPFIEEDFEIAFCSADERKQKREQKIKSEREKAMKKRLQSNPILALLRNEASVSVEVPESTTPVNKNQPDSVVHIEALVQQASVSSPTMRQNLPTRGASTTSKPAVRRDVPGSSSNVQSSSKFSKKTIFITNAAFGHAYNLARLYLSNGHRVIVQCEGPHTDKTIKTLQDNFGKDKLLAVQGRIYQEEFVQGLIGRAIEKFDRIDVVFHFATAICKVGAGDADESLRYLFEVNVKPFIYISKQLALLQKSPNTVKLIAVGPTMPPHAIQDNLQPNIELFLSYLRATVEELDASTAAKFRILSSVIDFTEFEELDFDSPNVGVQVCTKLMKVEQIMSENE